jgi:ABC-type Fe3+-hydroxamate transport system substrate-binding protein
MRFLHFLLALPLIVTLMPSFAEDVCAIGACSQLVGISKFSGDVPGAKRLPVVADFASVDAERIIALHPDVVVGIPSQSRLVAPLQRAGIHVVLLPDDTFEQIFTNMRQIGKLTGHEAAANAEVASLQAQTRRLAARVPHRAVPPSVFVALGTGPIWTAGASSFVGRLIALAGGRNAASDLAAPWGQFSDEALLRAQPDAIVSDRETNLAGSLDREPWRSLKAVREGHLFVTDERVNNALFRPGPHYNEGLSWLIERLSSLSTSTTPSARSNRN